MRCTRCARCGCEVWLEQPRICKHCISMRESLIASIPYIVALLAGLMIGRAL